ncbi:WecB/TagA/CpsF family glycosyltransferase [Candidatus Thioglobus sp.]|uniref:WecB/TagA/CpsF family glycosyltransferase n=1 Tax=Candidatus Thioglobus sp. TaxID=2026721 RepID=UPI003D0E9E9A
MSRIRKTIKLLGYDVFCGDLNALNLSNFSNKRKAVVNTINPHSYVVAKTDVNFEHSLKSSDFLIPDGSGIVLAARVLLNKKIDKVTGPDLHEYLLNDLNKTKGSCFYMGSSDATLGLIRDKVKKNYSSITVGVYSPPYKEKLSDLDNKEIIKQINFFSPDVLFIGMTAPKQEKWLEENKDKLNFGIASCVGAAFDWYAEVNKPPSRISKKLHLAWLERFFKEPIRMAPRIKSMLYFLYVIAMKKIKILVR